MYTEYEVCVIREAPIESLDPPWFCTTIQQNRIFLQQNSPLLLRMPPQFSAKGSYDLWTSPLNTLSGLYQVAFIHIASLTSSGYPLVGVPRRTATRKRLPCASVASSSSPHSISESRANAFGISPQRMRISPTQRIRERALREPLGSPLIGGRSGARSMRMASMSERKRVAQPSGGRS